MRNPNGYGGISKMSGNRRKPYRVRVTTGWSIGPDGRSRQEIKNLGYYESREEALQALARYNEQPYSISDGNTFAQIFEKWSAEHFSIISKSNAKAYTASFNLCKPLHDRIFADLRRNDLQSIVDTCGKNYPTLRKLKVLYSQLYRYAMQNDICNKDYSGYVDIAKYKNKTAEDIHKAFTTEEINILWQNADRSQHIQVILILIYSGVRISELLELKAENIHLEERYFDIIASKTSAGVRKVPIAKKTLPYWQSLCKNGTNQPFKTSYSNYLHARFLQPLEQIGLGDHLPHDTRHTCISLLVGANTNKILIKRIVGHQGDDVTDSVYTHFEIQQLIDAIDRI